MEKSDWYDGITPDWINTIRNNMINLKAMITMSPIADDYELPAWLNDMDADIDELKTYIESLPDEDED